MMMFLDYEAIEEFSRYNIYPTNSIEKDYSIICHYIKEKDVKTLTPLLEKTWDVDFRDHPHKPITPLFRAVVDKCYEIVELLLLRDADPDISYSGWQIDRPIHYATHAEDIQMIRLLWCYRAHPNLRDRAGRTCLGLACEKGNAQAAELLLGWPDGDPNQICNREGLSPLHVAVDWYKKYPKLSGPPHSLDLIKVLLKFKAKINNCRNKKYRSPLSFAKYPEVVELLVRNRAWIAGQEVLPQIAQTPEIITGFLNGGIRIDELRDKSNQSMLHYAAKSSCPHLVKTMMEKYPNLDVNSFMDDKGNTPLHVINYDIEDKETDRLFSCESHDVSNILWSYGGDFEMINKEGEKPKYVKYEEHGCMLTDKMMILEEHWAGTSESETRYSKYYRAELEKMKGVLISTYSKNYRLFDVLFVDMKRMMKFTTNEDFVELLNKYDNDFENKFLHFGWILNCKTNRAKLRKRLMDGAIDMIGISLGAQLPERCSEQIFTCFSTRELRSFNEEIKDG